MHYCAMTNCAALANMDRLAVPACVKHRMFLDIALSANFNSF
jgi:hypothetical protein